MSTWTSATSPARRSVAAPRPAATSCTFGASSNSGWSRTIMKTPAVTIVAAWMRALTGVGPSIASGSHVWSGSCADFATAAEQAERDQVRGPAAERAGLREDDLEVERAGALDEQEERERHRRVAEGVHHEGLLRGG